MDTRRYKFKNILIVHSNPIDDKITSNHLKTIFEFFSKIPDVKITSTNVEEVDMGGAYEIFLNSKQKKAISSSSREVANTPIIINEEPNALKFSETEKVKEAELILFVFPLIFCSSPSRVTAWLELVLDESFAFNVEKNLFYANGLLKGKSAGIISNIDAHSSDFGFKGKYVLTVEEMIEHLTHGTLAFSGFTVFPTFNVFNEEAIEVGSDPLLLHLKSLEELSPLYN